MKSFMKKIPFNAMLVDSEVWSFKTCEQSLESDLTGHLHDVVYN